MRVLFFIESLGPGGKERRLTELIYDLVKNHQYECELILTKNEVHYTKLNQVSIKPIVLPRKYKKDISLFFKFYKAAKQFKPDVIHVWGNLVATYALPSKIFLGIPLINSQITDAPNISKLKFNYRFNFYFSDRIIANSKTGLSRYGIDAKKGIVIYNGFDFERISKLTDKQSTKDKYQISTDKCVAMVATFSDSKDYNTYVSAALQLLQGHSDLTFLCVGSGDFTKHQNNIPEKYKSKVIFTGSVKDVESLMNICDVGVLTSFGEGISNSILEFMALSKPVIATNLGGNPELVEDKKSGYLIPVSSVNDLVNYLDVLLNDEKQRLQMGKQGQQIVKEKFGMQRMTNEFINVYQEMIA